MKKINKTVLKIVVLVSFVFCFGIYPQKVKAADKTLQIDQNLIDQVGIQSSGSGNCSAYAMAYCRTILEGRVRNWSDFWVDGIGAKWSNGNYTMYYSTEKLSVFQTIVDNINAGRPVIIYVGYTGLYDKYDHWVAIVGYQNVTDKNNLSADNFMMYDSGYTYQRSTAPIEPLSIRGCDLGLNNGSYCYLTTTDSQVTDNTPPVISDVKVSDITKDGYTVTCTVTDDVGVTDVKFPSWNSDIHGGDKANWELNRSVSGTTATCRVTIADLESGAIEGNYMTHIYAYDAAGNGSSASIGNAVYIDHTDPVISNVKVDKDETGYTITCNVTDNYSGVDRVQFPAWTSYKDQDDIFSDWSTSSAARGKKEDDLYTYRVEKSAHNNEDGMYLSEIYAFDKFGNQTKYSPIREYFGEPMQILDSKTYNGHTYYLINNPQNLMWNYCQVYSEENGGYLATVTSDEENEVIHDMLTDNNIEMAYLGGRDSKNEGTWEWFNGEAWSYTNWSSGQPSNQGEFEGGQDYLGIMQSGKWNDCWKDPSLHEKATTTDLKLTAFVMEVPKIMEDDGTSEGSEPSDHSGRTDNSHEVIPGDLNGDGTVNSTDVILLRRYIAGGYGVSINEDAADVNADGKLNSSDVILIRRYIAGGYGVELK